MNNVGYNKTVITNAPKRFNDKTIRNTTEFLLHEDYLLKQLKRIRGY
jgi:hypothetical protein